MSWKPDTWSGADGWYEIEREPDFAAREYLEYDPDLKTIVIKKLEKTAEEILTEEKQKLEAEGFTPEAFADLVKRVEALEKGGL